MIRTIALIGAFLIGGLFPELSILKGYISLLIIYMLVPVFLRLRLNKDALTREHLKVLSVNLTLPFLVWATIRAVMHDEHLAMAGFFIAATPTATGASVIMGLLGGNVSFVVTGFVLTNLATSLLYPIAVPLMAPGVQVGHLVIEVLLRVLLITAVPAVIAWAIAKIWGPRTALRLGNRLTPSTFYTWIAIVIIVAATSVQLMRSDESVAIIDCVHVAVLSLVLATLMFGIGFLIGCPRYGRECSQMLGQKNTSYSVYIALALHDPIVVLGPALYVFFHNTWNGIQIGLAARKARIAYEKAHQD